MFVLEKKFGFEAMHVLKGHDGKCARPHGHSYRVVLEVSGRTLVGSGPKRNMLMDFEEISREVRGMVDLHLDHANLNESLGTDSPTAEFIAVWIFIYLRKRIPLLVAVTVEETASSRATYRPDMSTEDLKHVIVDGVVVETEKLANGHGNCD
eukprot:CAMPEP_0184681870 /NCGR_PEP_ID=MMETSP0312-20130426/4867_1 /TAXON_ID=31354 /ORGANISM="Compsopogon coeruleus, Strain SAG 36.94" /LENGTH=151 /DNA_ID=CAMNT_0027132999 /DNA_START=215 /DNA_END=670 /DNA_ORIENTATION=-